MARYQVIYTKNQPLTTWKETKEQALGLAKAMEKQGYQVSIYEHSENGAKKVES